MERMGPESLMVMAAGRIARQPRLGEGPLWEIPLAESRPAPDLLAAAPLRYARPGAAADRGWLARIQDWRGAGRTPRGL